MNFEVMGYVLYGALLFAASIVLACVVFACVYDISRVSQKIAFRRKIAGRLQKRPHVTILIYIDGSNYGLANCLRSIAKNRYQSYDVVIVDNMSNASVRRQTKRLIRSAARMPICFYKNGRKVSQNRACREGYKRSMRGDIVLIITPMTQLPPRTLKGLAIMAAMQPDINCFRLPLVWGGRLAIETSYVQLRLAGQDMVQKVRSTLLDTEPSSLLVGGVYTKNAVISKNKKRIRSQYVSDIPLLINTSGIWGRPKQIMNPASVSGAVLASVCLWLAISTDINQPLLIIWGIVCAWTIASLIQAEHIVLLTKVHLLGSAFIAMYLYVASGILYAMHVTGGVIQKNIAAKPRS